MGKSYNRNQDKTGKYAEQRRKREQHKKNHNHIKHGNQKIYVPLDGGDDVEQYMHPEQE